MSMGAYGCVWMLWGAGDTGGHGNKTRRGHLGPSRSAMTGEISPDMMFFGFCQKWSKWVQRGADGYILVQWGVCARGRTKTRQKNVQIIDQDMF